MGKRIFSTGTLSAIVPNPAYIPGGGGNGTVPATLTVTGAGIAGANGTYNAGGSLYNGMPLYTGGNVGGSLGYGGDGFWYLFYNSSPGGNQSYKGGSLAGPASANGVWTSLVGGTAPTVVGSGGTVPAANTTAGNGAPATLTVPLLNLQSITFELMAQVKDLWQPVMVSAFPERRAYYNVHLTGKAKIATVSASALQALVGMSFAGGTPNVGTLGKTIALPPFAGVFSTVDVNGVPIVINAPNVTCPGVSLPFSMDDFTMPDFSIDCFPDPVSKIVATTQIG